MGGSPSKFEERVEKQELYVRKRERDADMQVLKVGMFGHRHTSKQIQGVLRQEYHGTRDDVRNKNSYVMDYEYKAVRRYR